MDNQYDTEFLDHLASFASQPQATSNSADSTTDDTGDSTGDETSSYTDDDFKALQDSYDELSGRLETLESTTKATYNGDDEFLQQIFSMTDNEPIDISYMPQVRSKNIPASVMGGFQSFATPEEGEAALENQLTRYNTGHNQVGVHADDSLYTAMAHYAPAGDGSNNPKVYAETIAKGLGISPNTPISQINPQAWAAQIAKVEGNKHGNNPGNLRTVKRQNGGYTDDVSMQGYNVDSPYNHNPFLDINSPTGDITLEHTNIPLLGIDEYGNKKLMKPGNKYKFDGTQIREYKL